MLSKVEVRTRQGDLLSLPLDDDSSGFRVADIQGLDPVKATLVSTSFAGVAGEQYQSSRLEARNIKMQIELDPDPATDTVRDLREMIYEFFMPESEVSFRFFMADGLVVDIEGRVETCESAMFTQEPAVDISVMCFKPAFYELIPVLVPGATTSGTAATIIDYPGSLKTGIQLVLRPNRSLPGFTVYHVPPNNQTQTLDFANAPLVAGDVLTISTVSGAKGATLVRAGTSSSVLYGVSPQSSWIELLRGKNSIRVYAEGLSIPLTIEYTKRYGGL